MTVSYCDLYWPSPADGLDAALHAEMDKYKLKFAHLGEAQKALSMQLQQVCCCLLRLLSWFGFPDSVYAGMHASCAREVHNKIFNSIETKHASGAAYFLL